MPVRRGASRRPAGDGPAGLRPDRRRSPTLVRLESRDLTAVTSTVDPSGLLRISADAADQVVVQGNGADVWINGADPSTGPFPLAGIRTIEIVETASAGPDANVFYL